MHHRRTRWLALILVALAVATFAALSGTDEAAARPCCSSCDSGYEYCLANCGYTPECFEQCDAQWFNCYRWCSFSC